jgi:hypothetical protein
MENLSEKVYECTLPVEAHMICDLLARAGISARVEGEFLAGAGGDLPLGSAVKVRVAPERAAEAREVIAEWERLQPPPDPSPATPRKLSSSIASPMWFAIGAIAGSLVTAFALRSPHTTQGIDYDGDGDLEVTWHYEGQVISRTDSDRNDDGETDARVHFDLRGFETTYESDDDFDGRFEGSTEMREGRATIARIDADGDGRPESILRFRDDIVESTEILDEEETRIVLRDRYRHGIRESAEVDRDGDGVFEERIEFDRLGLPKGR